jgi:hypothetical protein
VSLAHNFLGAHTLVSGLKSKRMHRFFWLVIITGAVALNATHSNLEFAVGFTIPWFLLGLILSPIGWLATKKGRKDPWQWFHWLNAAAYIMFILFVLRYAIHSYVGSVDTNAAESVDVVERTALHEKVEQAIVSLGSPDSTSREEAATFLLTAPPVFRRNIEAIYKNEVDATAESLPKQIDEYTTLQSVFVTADATHISYRVHFDDHALSSDEQKDLSDSLRDQAVLQTCGDGGTVLLSMLFGKDVVRTYSYSDGQMFFQTRVSWGDCQALR